MKSSNNVPIFIKKNQNLYDKLTQFFNGSIKYNDEKFISNVSIISSVIIIIFIIGICLLYQNNNKKSNRLLSAVFLGIGGTLLYSFVVLMSISYALKKPTPIQTYIHLFTIFIFTFLYAVYCIFPLIIYVDKNENIYNDSKSNNMTSNNISNSVNIIRLITNILVITVMIYIIYLLLWQKNITLLKRQLLPIAVIFGIATARSVYDIINNFGH
jgi:cytochrome bd-type quinol oxidase subunit 2